MHKKSSDHAGFALEGALHNILLCNLFLKLHKDKKKYIYTS